MSSLKPARTYRITKPNGNHYLITYDYAAGHRDRYTVLRWRVGRRATIIGRELTLGHAKRVCAA